jgi:hypothetical protein
MATLAPSAAATIAERVYQIQSSDTDISTFFDSEIKDAFSLPDKSRFEGTSGGAFLNSKTGFGIVARGKEEFEGDVLVAVRGTASLYDAITDVHAGTLYPSSTGKMVHSGFNKVFLSFKRDLEDFFTQFSPRRVHCVGHSLGGALATLTAEWVAAQRIGEPVLYTFGCPRVGNADFAKYITSNVKDNNIYRVYHKTDPVSMVPIWPFAHAPLPGTECFIDKPGTFAPSMHKMSNYLSSVSGTRARPSSWADLKRNRPAENNDKVIEAWMNIRGPISMSYFNVVLVQQALAYIVKKALYLTGVVVQFAFVMAPSNFLDILAASLEVAAKASIEVAGYIKSLMLKILSMLGVVVDTVRDITASFIRWVLRRFLLSINLLVQVALRQGHD